jgi:hypothetical protein
MRSRAISLGVAVVLLALFAGGHATGNVAAATIPLRYGPIAENVDIDPGTSYATAWLPTSECHGITVLVNHPSGSTLLLSMDVGVPDAGTVKPIVNMPFTAARQGADGTYFIWNSAGLGLPAGSTLLAPALRPVFFGAGPAHINKAWVYCNP